MLVNMSDMSDIEFREQLNNPKVIVAIEIDELYAEAKQLARLLGDDSRDPLVEAALHTVTGQMSTLLERSNGLTMRREIGVDEFEDIQIDGCYVAPVSGRMIGIARTAEQGKDRYISLEPKNFTDHPGFEYAFTPWRVTPAGHDMIDRHLLEHNQTDHIMSRIIGTPRPGENDTF